MPTKWYFRNTDASEGPTSKASPDTDSFPSVPADKNTPKQMTLVSGSGQVSVAASYATAANSYTMARIFVGPPLSAQKLTGSQTGFQVGIALSESSVQMNLYHRVFVYVWRSGVGNVKSITSAPVSCGTEAGTSEGGCVITFTGASGDFDILNGDRIVVEEWWDIRNTKNTSYTATDWYDGTTEPVEGSANSNSASYFYSPQTLYDYFYLEQQLKVLPRFKSTPDQVWRYEPHGTWPEGTVTTEAAAFRSVPPRTVFKVGSYYYVFYKRSTDNYLVSKSSTDGINWGNETVASHAPIEEYGAWYENSTGYLYVGYNTGTSNTSDSTATQGWSRRATVIGGTPTWATQVALTQAAGYWSFTFCKGDSTFWLVARMYYPNGYNANYYWFAYRSSDDGASYYEWWYFDSTQGNSFTPLIAKWAGYSDGVVLVHAYYPWGNWGYWLWSGSWSTLLPFGQLGGYANSNASIVFQNNKTHFVHSYVDTGGSVRYLRLGSGTTWSPSETVVDSSTTCKNPVLSAQSDKLYLTYLKGTEFWVSTMDYSTEAWSSPKSVFGSSNSPANLNGEPYPSTTGGTIGIAWREGSAAPYMVRFINNLAPPFDQVFTATFGMPFWCYDQTARFVPRLLSQSDKFLKSLPRFGPTLSDSFLKRLASYSSLKEQNTKILSRFLSFGEQFFSSVAGAQTGEQVFKFVAQVIPTKEQMFQTSPQLLSVFDQTLKYMGRYTGDKYFKLIARFLALPDQSVKLLPRFLKQSDQTIKFLPMLAFLEDHPFKVSPAVSSLIDQYLVFARLNLLTTEQCFKLSPYSATALHQTVIDGVDRTGDTLGWDVEQSVTYGPWKASITFKNTVPVSMFSTVEILGVYNGLYYTIFKGVITATKQVLEEKTIVCEALNYTYFLKFRLMFNQTYTEKKAHEIIKDIITTYVPDITTNNLYTGFTNVYTITFDGIDVFEAIRKIAEAEDANFYVTDTKDLYFYPKNLATTGSIALEQGNNILSMRREINDSRLTNWLNVIGGSGFIPASRDAYTDSGSQWGYSGSDSASVSYDYSIKYTGSCSIKCTSSYSGSDVNIFYYPASQDLGWVFGQTIDAMCFRIRSDIKSGQNGWTGSTPVVELHTDETKYAYQAIPITASQVNSWISKTLAVGSGSSGWTLTGSFSWCADPVNYILFKVQTPYSAGTGSNHYLWIDNLYFHENQIEITKQDATSQTAYGRRDSYKSDKSLTNYTFLTAWAQTQIDSLKEPYTKLEVVTKYIPGQVWAGQKVLVTASDCGYVNEPFTVLDCRFTLREGEVQTHLVLSRIIPLELEEVLSKLRREIYDVARRTA